MKKIKTSETATKKLPNQKNAEKINEPTKEILSLTKQLVDLDARYEIASKEKAKLYDARKNLQAELSDKMKELDLENFRSSEFGLVSRTHRLWARITDMDLASKWLEEEGLYDEVLKLEPVNARLNEIVKKLLEEGKMIPPGIDYSMTKSISIRTA